MYIDPEQCSGQPRYTCKYRRRLCTLPSPTMSKRYCDHQRLSVCVSVCLSVCLSVCRLHTQIINIFEPNVKWTWTSARIDIWRRFELSECLLVLLVIVLFQPSLTGDEEVEQSDVVDEVTSADDVERDVTRQSRMTYGERVAWPERRR